jgi:hypothetical protein
VVTAARVSGDWQALKVRNIVVGVSPWVMFPLWHSDARQFHNVLFLRVITLRQLQLVVLEVDNLKIMPLHGTVQLFGDGGVVSDDVTACLIFVAENDDLSKKFFKVSSLALSAVLTRLRHS